ncbi:kynureninase [Mucilaginibacter sp. Bleaf8]|uniref:kynureninase n=1 Tax=Mucilaginibacter sp. Bleaf8 TaxID=2834430 RepID=UPI001BCBA55E|nr:kynureninase [Mucilaginibacter sp. Bleaf8]MBS7563298.1 kynureninase [Mucilaginibacter sp. Bleaf8]
MNFENTPAFARQLDEKDPLWLFRQLFLIPQHQGKDAVYLCGNSLGLQPKSSAQHIAGQLKVWQDYAVEGWFEPEQPWLTYHQQLKAPLARIVGALPQEVTVMNSLTVNLHLLMVSFYQPTKKRYKILMEAGAFPSDQYAVESQVRYHGFAPDDAIIEIHPRAGESTLHTEDITDAINRNSDVLALVLFSGINYYTGQFFDLKAIAHAGHQAGAYVGFDLAHAAGNVPLNLHDWGVDFATWCSYKYMNSGPGGISGIFVHEKHFHDAELNRFAGWWGYHNDTRFRMTPGFKPEFGAEGWQVSTSPILLMAAHKAALDIFEQAGSIPALRQKSLLLTAYLEFLIQEINAQQGDDLFRIITPHNQQGRGCQLSVICKHNGKKIFDHLVSRGVIGDWREPDVIRLSPVPLYNSFTDVFEAAQALAEAVK